MRLYQLKYLTVNRKYAFKILIEGGLILEDFWPDFPLVYASFMFFWFLYSLLFHMELSLIERIVATFKAQNYEKSRHFIFGVTLITVKVC